MSRPTYEREEHLVTERKVADAMEAMHGMRLKKTPKYYHIDYAIVDRRDRVVGWMEVRSKNFAKNAYNDFYTSLEKYISVARMGHLTGRSAVLVSVWTDCIQYAPVHHGNVSKYNITVSGRTVNSRNDPDDIEPVIHIPLDHFRPLSDIEMTLRI